jgi:hypothetical protein
MKGEISDIRRPPTPLLFHLFTFIRMPPFLPRKRVSSEDALAGEKGWHANECEEVK